MPVSMATYERVALEDPEGHWEMVCGRLREKPPMSTAHNGVQRRLHKQLAIQLPDDAFTVSAESARPRIEAGTYFVPDVCVIPIALERRLREQPGTFEVYPDPMPLVVEVWSPSTGDHDIETKLVEYQERGDLEIWRIHPYERTLTAWQRRPDGSYAETVHRGGTIEPTALPGVTIKIDRLFD